MKTWRSCLILNCITYVSSVRLVRRGGADSRGGVWNGVVIGKEGGIVALMMGMAGSDTNENK